MPISEYSDDCPGCQPAVMNTLTGQMFSNDSPEMVAINKMWAETTLQERQVFHRVCCKNSRAPEDLAVMASLSQRIEATLAGFTAPSTEGLNIQPLQLVSFVTVPIPKGTRLWALALPNEGMGPRVAALTEKVMVVLSQDVEVCWAALVTAAANLAIVMSPEEAKLQERLDTLMYMIGVTARQGFQKMQEDESKDDKD